MPSEHDGIIDGDRTYTTRALARILGFKQARTIEDRLRARGIGVDDWGHGTVLVSGKTVQLAIERSSECDDEDPSESE
jgi:hypothetical protein